MGNLKEIHCGDRILELCKAYSINQSDLSKKMNIPATTLSGWITKSDIPLKKIRKICNALDIELWEFFINKQILAKHFEINENILEICQIINSIPDDKQVNFINHIKTGLRLIFDELKFSKTVADIETPYHILKNK